MNNELDDLREKYPDQVKAVLNILLESPYFYRGDDDIAYLFLRRYQQEFRDFFRKYFGWELIMDGKCARVYKEAWYNEAVTPANRLQFYLGKRDECIAFMLLIEFYEKLLEENSMTVEEAGNPHFRFGDLLEYQQRRFIELFGQKQTKYTAEHVRKNILSPLMPRLIRYRFIKELPRPHGLELSRDQFIYEALPALYHYNSGRLGDSVGNDPYLATGQDDFTESEEVNDNEQA
jgi:hypothetical protein